MAPKKKIITNQLTEGLSVADLFMVKEMSRAETRSGKPYLIMTLMDRSGEVAARLWENADVLMEECKPGNLVQVSAQAQAYRGTLQLNIDSVSKLDREAADLALFLQASSKNIGDMTREIQALAAGVKDPFCGKLLDAFFRDDSFLTGFQRAPAAKTMHHAYLGGLLEHTLAVARLAEMLADFYPSLDRDLLQTGALLHDIGKTKELSFETFPFDYTDKGRLMGHLTLGTGMIQERINGLTGFPDDLATRLLHLVLSHHGRYEFGSPTLPMMSEAFVLNFLDDLDAKMNFMGRHEEQAPAAGYQWTDFQRTLERFLYIKGRPHDETPPAAESSDEDKNDGPEENSQKQQPLF